MPGPILWGPNDTANNLQLNLTQSGRYIGVGASLPWASGVNYQTNDLIVYSGNIYQCVISHPSNSFASDLAAGNWRLFNIDPINKNYIQIGSNFENALVSGWTAARSSSMTNNFPSSVGTGGNAFSSTNGGTTATTAIAPAVTGTNPLDGDFSLVFETTGTGATAGDMYISQAYEIDLSDQAKVLQFKFAYELVQDTSSANTNFSGTTSNTFGVAIYDLVNNAWIQPAGVFNFVQKSGVGYCTGTFQTSYNMTNFQIAVYVANSAASTSQAIKLYLDDFYVGPQITQVGSPITDFQAFTPTFNWSTGYTTSGYYRRIGDSAEFVAKMSLTGTPLASSELIMTLPFGWQIDTTKLQASVAGDAPTYGDGIGRDNSTTNLYLFRVQYWSATSVKVFYQSSSTGQESAVTTSVPPTWTTNDTIVIRFQVPIVGWSSSLELSSSTDTRVIAARLGITSAQALPAAGNTKINLDNAFLDTAGGLDTVNKQWVVPVSGIYEISATLGITVADPIVIRYRLTINGVVTNFYGQQNASVTRVGASPVIVQMNAGDNIQVFAINTAGTTINTAAADTYVSIKRLTGPSVIAASETVAMRAYKNTGSNTTSGTWQTVASYNASPYDTHNCFNETTGQYTVPVSGAYLISSTMGFISNATGARGVRVDVTGTGLVLGGNFLGTNTTGTGTASTVSGIVNLTAGQIITIASFQGSGGSLAYDTTANYNHLSIVRVGN